MAQGLLEHFVQANDGVLNISAAAKLGISPPTLYAFARARGLERISKGIYADPHGWHDEMWLVSLRWPRAVFSHESALLIHSLTDREPASLSVTVPSGYNASALRRSGIDVFYIKPELLGKGMNSVITTDGHAVPCYDLERTICDTIRSRSHLDPQALTTALKCYVRRGDKQLDLLDSYAKDFRIGGLVAQYLEVLL